MMIDEPEYAKEKEITIEVETFRGGGNKEIDEFLYQMEQKLFMFGTKRYADQLNKTKMHWTREVNEWYTAEQRDRTAKGAPIVTWLGLGQALAREYGSGTTAEDNLQEYLEGSTMRYQNRESLPEYFARVGIMRRKLPSAGLISTAAFNERVLSVLKTPFPMAHAQVRKNEADYRAKNQQDRNFNLNELRSEMERYQKVNVPALVATAGSASQGPAASNHSVADAAELARYRAQSNASRQQGNRGNGGNGSGGNGGNQSGKKRLAAMVMKAERQMYKYDPIFIAQLKQDGRCFNCGEVTQHLAWQCENPIKDLALEAGHPASQLKDSSSAAPRPPRADESRKRSRVEVKAVTVKAKSTRSRSKVKSSHRKSRSRSRSPSN